MVPVFTIGWLWALSSLYPSFPRKREPRDFSHLPLGPRLCGDDECVRLQDFLTASSSGMTTARSALASLVVGLGLIAAVTRPAGAQDEALPGGLQIFATPYLWLGGVHETIQTPIPRAPSVGVDISALDVLDHLSAVPFMGSLEIRDGPFGLLGDAFHIPLGTGITTPRDLFSGGHAALITDQGTALLLYRPLEQPTQYADLGIGFRAWGFTANLTLNPGRLPGASTDRSTSWVDPLIGGRYHIDLPSGFLPSGFGLTGYGDVGGFGVGAHSDWQLLGSIDYTPTPWINLHLGYRTLNFSYTASGGLNLGYDVHMRGPILAATFRF
jgi:hypothetical protein